MGEGKEGGGLASSGINDGCDGAEARRGCARQSGRCDRKRSIVPRDELKGQRGARYTSVNVRSRASW